MVLQPALDYGRMQPATAAIAGIRAIAARLNARLDPPVRVRLTGTVAMEHEELTSVSRGAEFGATATILLVAAVLALPVVWLLLAVSAPRRHLRAGGRLGPGLHNALPSA